MTSLWRVSGLILLRMPEMEATEDVGDGRRNVHVKRTGAHILNTTYPCLLPTDSSCCAVATNLT